MDNRIKEKNEALAEIENDDTPIVESEQPREDESAIETPEEETPVVDTPEDEAPIVDDEEVIEPPEEKPEEPEKPVVTPPNDQEKRLRESTREAQLLHERNKQLTEALSKMEETVEPTEEELSKYVRADGVDYDELSTFERAMVKKNYINEQKLSHVSNAVKDVKHIDEWAAQVDTFIDTNDAKQTRKELVGRDSEFRSFAMQASHRGISLDILASAFLSDMPAKRSGGSMFATNQGGEKPKVVTSEIDDAEKAANLRQTDPKEYARQIKAGNIKVAI